MNVIFPVFCKILWIERKEYCAKFSKSAYDSDNKWRKFQEDPCEEQIVKKITNLKSRIFQFDRR